jgi:endonuclease III
MSLLTQDANMPKAAFNINSAIQRIDKAVQPFPKAAMFELFDEGFTSAFEQLVACIISIRTYDEVTLPTARRLFAQARTAQALSRLSLDEIKALIRSSTFYENKAEQLHTIAERVHQEYSDVLPCDRDVLLSLPGVGPKCANLVLGLACSQPFIGVDIHVHRVTNRWGYVDSPTPERTILALEAKLPRDYWLEINRLLVPFGKHICTGTRPHCSTCPLLDMCQQIGVQNPR